MDDSSGKPYQSPQLERIGTLSALTASGSAGDPEGNQGQGQKNQSRPVAPGG